jgi:polyisoprenoid-binding protein YceI
MKHRILSMGMAAAVLIGSSALAQGTYEVDPVHSAVLFKVQHAGAGYTWGRFTDFSGSLRLDAAAPERSRLELTVKSASVLTDDAKRDQHLRSPDFFNVRQFPVITFRSTAVRTTGPDSAVVTGELTLKGVTKSVSAEARRVGQQGDLVGFEAAFSLKRSEFGMDWGVGKGLGDEVWLIVSLEAGKTK